MLPRIIKEKGYYVVQGRHGSDECKTLKRAIRYWLWHCGMPARWAFKNLD